MYFITRKLDIPTYLKFLECWNGSLVLPWECNLTMLRKLQVESNQLIQHQFASNDQDSPLHVRSWFSCIFFRIIFVLFRKMLKCHSALGLIFLTTKLFVLRKLDHVRCWFPMIIFEKIWKNNIDKLVFRISNFECPTMPQLSLAHFSLLLRLLFLLTKRPFPG